MNACSRLLLRGTARATRHANNNCTSSIGSLSVSTANRFQHSTSFHLPDPTISLPTESLNQPLVKVVATIGPTSEAAEPLLQCVQAGLNAMRLNFSHATPDEVELRCRNLHAANEYVTKQQYKGLSQLQDTVTILLDTKGPELRTGTLADDTSGHHTVALDQGATVTLHASAATMPNTSGGTATDLLIDFPPLASVLQPGRLVLLDDGAVVLTVHSVSADTNTIACTVQHSGSVRSRAGVNLPLANTAPHLPALSEQDQSDIAYGMTAADVDVVAASFVQTAQHVTDLRAHVASVAATLESYTSDPTKALPLIVSKIETASALENFDEILAVSDGIMVARGDLGVEIPLAQVTNAQKEMVAACNAAGKPVIVATQMMESMSKAPRPTRAEVSDVTNAVYDGADCVMLSGETAKGKYPVATIQTMKDIIRAAERFAIHQTEVAGKPVTTPTLFAHSPGTPVSAVAKAAVTAAHDTATSCAAIVVALPPPSAVGVGSFTPHPYHLAGLVAAHRPNVPVYVLCRSAKQARQLQLYRGLYPVVVGADTLASKTISSQTLLGHIPAGSSVVCVEQDTEDAAPAMTFCTVE